MTTHGIKIHEQYADAVMSGTKTFEEPELDGLKPCPFCGGDATVSDDSGRHGEMFSVWHKCPNDGGRFNRYGSVGALITTRANRQSKHGTDTPESATATLCSTYAARLKTPTWTDASTGSTASARR